MTGRRAPASRAGVNTLRTQQFSLKGAVWPYQENTGIREMPSSIW